MTAPVEIDLARIEALARAAQDAQVAALYEAILDPRSAAWKAAVHTSRNAREVLHAALSPAVVLALVSQVRAATADTARLDWIEERAVSISPIMELDAQPGDPAWTVDPYEYGITLGETLRGTIDAAREA